MQKYLQNLIEYIHNNWESKIPGQVGRNSLIHRAFEPFFNQTINHNFQNSTRYSYYKAYDQPFRHTGDFLRSFSIPKLQGALSEWNEKESWTKSRNPISVRIDGTKTGHHYGRNIPHLKWLYDHVSQAIINTHEIYLLLVSIGEEEYVVDFQISVDDHSPHNIAKSLLDSFLQSIPKTLAEMLLQKARLSLDGAWGTADFFLWLQELGWKKVTIKSGGRDLIQRQGHPETISLVDYEYEMIDYLDKNPLKWRSFNVCHKLNNVLYHCEKIYFPTIDSDLIALLVKYPGKKQKKDRHILLLSLAGENWHHFQILQNYINRWPIETMIRTTKQKLKLNDNRQHIKQTTINEKRNELLLTQAQVRAFKRIHMNITLKLVMYMGINWYRVRYTRRSRTSLKQVLNRIQKYFSQISPRQLPKLIAGKLE